MEYREVEPVSGAHSSWPSWSLSTGRVMSPLVRPLAPSPPQAGLEAPRDGQAPAVGSMLLPNSGQVVAVPAEPAAFPAHLRGVLAAPGDCPCSALVAVGISLLSLRVARGLVQCQPTAWPARAVPWARRYPAVCCGSRCVRAGARGPLGVENLQLVVPRWPGAGGLRWPSQPGTPGPDTGSPHGSLAPQG